MCALVTGVQTCALPILDGAVVGGSDGVHQVVPYACLPPSGEAVVTGGTWAIALRQVAPRRTGTQHPEDAVQHAPIIDARHPSRLVGQQRLGDCQEFRVRRGIMGKRSEEHTSELQSLMRISYAVFCLKKKKKNTTS